MNLAQAKMKQMYLETQAKLCKSYAKEMTAETGKLRVVAVKFSPSEDEDNPVYFFELPTVDTQTAGPAAKQAAGPAAKQAAGPAAKQAAGPAAKQAADRAADQADKREAKINEG